jgi:hypothetical protein
VAYSTCFRLRKRYGDRKVIGTYRSLAAVQRAVIRFADNVLAGTDDVR